MHTLAEYEVPHADTWPVFNWSGWRTMGVQAAMSDPEVLVLAAASVVASALAKGYRPMTAPVQRVVAVADGVATVHYTFRVLACN